MNKESNSDQSSEILEKSIVWIKEHFGIYITLAFLSCSAAGYISEYLLLKEFAINAIAFSEIDDFFLAALKLTSTLLIILIFPIILLTALHMIYIMSSIATDLKKVKNSFQTNEIKKSMTQASEIPKILEEIEIQEEIEKNKKSWEKCYAWFSSLFKKVDHKKLYQEIREQAQELDKAYKRAKAMENEVKMIDKKIRYDIFFMGTTIVLFVLYIAWSIHSNLKAEIDRIVENPTTMATIQLRNKIEIPNIHELNKPLVFITATNKFR